MTLLDERLTDEAVRKRLNSCGPWVKALLTKMLPQRPLHLPEGLRFLVFDGTSIQAPGAKGTDYRLHVGIDLVTLEFTHLLITDQHTGESLKNFSLAKDEVAVVDRGMCHANAILEKRASLAHVIARYHYTTMPLYQKEDETPIDIVKWLKEEPKVSYRSLAVKAGSCEREKLEGSLIALRLPKREAKIARSRLKSQPKRSSQTDSENVISSRIPSHFYHTFTGLTIRGNGS